MPFQQINYLDRNKIIFPSTNPLINKHCYNLFFFFNLNVLEKNFSNEIVAKQVKGILVYTGLNSKSAPHANAYSYFRIQTKKVLVILSSLSCSHLHGSEDMDFFECHFKRKKKLDIL